MRGDLKPGWKQRETRILLQDKPGSESGLSILSLETEEPSIYEIVVFLNFSLQMKGNRAGPEL